jgi:hypothetical protein
MTLQQLVGYIVPEEYITALFQQHAEVRRSIPPRHNHLPNHTILTLTTLWIFTNVIRWKQEPKNNSDQSVDIAYWRNGIASLALCRLLTQYLIPHCCKPLKCYGLFYVRK